MSQPGVGGIRRKLPGAIDLKGEWAIPPPAAAIFCAQVHISHDASQARLSCRDQQKLCLWRTLRQSLAPVPSW